MPRPCRNAVFIAAAAPCETEALPVVVSARPRYERAVAAARE